MSAEELRTARANAPPPSTPLAIAKHKDPNSPESKKELALNNGPIHYLTYENATRLGLSAGENVLTALMDIFNLTRDVSGGITHGRTGVIYPQRFLEIFKMENESFRTAQHQDAHEFFGLVLNSVIRWFEENEGVAGSWTPRQHEGQQQLLMANDDLSNVEEHNHDEGDGTQKINGKANGGITQGIQDAIASAGSALGLTNSNNSMRLSAVETLKSIFEGVLTSETRCLTCELTSRRDETFLDLSIDLSEHSSVTSCLLSFSAEEMLCERNKFHCDNCGGLQEAEKRMKIRKLPKVLTLHLKRFRYTDDMSRLLKVGARVTYPYTLRLFNTLPEGETEGSDRLYELYAVVVHVGGNAYQGHYVSVIKTKEWGWLLFDDEMVERVDKSYVRNFFGDKPGSATAYVLFYQETTEEDVRREQEAEGLEEVQLATKEADVSAGHVYTNGTMPGGVLEQQLKEAGLVRSPSLPVKAHDDGLPNLDHAATSPLFNTGTFSSAAPASVTSDGHSTFSKSPSKSTSTSVSKATKEYKEKIRREEKERKAAAKELERKQMKANDEERKEKYRTRKEHEKQRRDEEKNLEKALRESMKEDKEKKEREEMEARQMEAQGAALLGTSAPASSTAAVGNGNNAAAKENNFYVGSPSSGSGFSFGSMKLSRNKAGSRSVSGKKSFSGWLGRDKKDTNGRIDEGSVWDDTNTPPAVPELPNGVDGARGGMGSRGSRPPMTPKSMTTDGLGGAGSPSSGGGSRFSFGLGKKKSSLLGGNGA